MKRLIQSLLRHKAKRFLAKHKPRVVAVTGSVGKTSTRMAIALVLSGRFKVRTAPENYNNEFGVPLAILGLKSPGRSILGWLSVLLHREKDPPNVLVLEFGADRPGDIAALCDIVPPEVGVVTALSPVHAEYFENIEKLAEEKAILVERLPEDGLAVLNADDEQVSAFASKTRVSVIRYGFSSADVQAGPPTLSTREDFSFDPGETFCSLTFPVRGKTGEAAIFLPNVLGRQQATAALAAVAVGEHFGLTVGEMAETLKNYQVPPGRLRPIPGIKGTLILDDSYNAAPASVAAALRVLREFHPVESRRRIAVLGDMAELGQYREQEHRQIGLLVADAADVLACVGEKAKGISEGAREAGMDPDVIKEFLDVEDAGRWLDPFIKQGDVILVKGSQSSRMEKIVKEVMAEPLRASELLVRQYGKWISQ
ncbi:MAG TPA: UDP-N-acetylmuramoyl-tripeptide--D-alanyl-D-alanine ligase [Patescibacteria group bacterium]|nr:UDP-N-acetylmuramoyl-tripeptide--D-alanyl-D-alanine ligase [Patescibacteria group bacterium]